MAVPSPFCRFHRPHPHPTSPKALVDHKLEPAIKPFHGQVNARDVYDIERFDETATRGVVVTLEDNAKYYGHFDHIMSHQWQQEILGE